MGDASSYQEQMIGQDNSPAILLTSIWYPSKHHCLCRRASKRWTWKIATRKRQTQRQKWQLPYAQRAGAFHLASSCPCVAMTQSNCICHMMNKYSFSIVKGRILCDPYPQSDRRKCALVMHSTGAQLHLKSCFKARSAKPSLMQVGGS